MRPAMTIEEEICHLIGNDMHCVLAEPGVHSDGQPRCAVEFLTPHVVQFTCPECGTQYQMDPWGIATLYERPQDWCSEQYNAVKAQRGAALRAALTKVGR